jgi:2-iminobutanoate/2-iminopropanoate deaminase
MRREAQQNPRRRSMIKGVLASLAAAGAGMFGVSQARSAPREARGIKHISSERLALLQQQPPLFSGAVVHNGLVYVAGKGYHEEGDIRKHTTEVLNQIEAELVKAGSSMDRVLKVNVYLHDIKDYAAMNEVYRGRFGNRPPVRTTIATYGGIPGNSLVEIDCIAAVRDEA